LKITSQTEKVIAEINEFSGGRLKNIRELSVLFESAVTDESLWDTFYQMQFIAKYLNGLGKILESNVQFTGRNTQASIDPEQARKNIMQEYRENLILFTDLLRKLIRETDDEFRAEMEKNYLSLNTGSVANINSLIYDLSWMKKYYNSKKK
jgi:hypothetical protein